MEKFIITVGSKKVSEQEFEKIMGITPNMIGIFYEANIPMTTSDGGVVTIEKADDISSN